MPNIKHISRLLIAIMTVSVVALLTACSSEDLTAPGGVEAEDGYININLRSSKIASRGESGSDLLNENLIKSALVCLYPNNNPSGTPAVAEYFTNLDVNSTTTVKIRLTAELRGMLFNDGTNSCSAYVAANITDEQGKSVTNATRLEDIRNFTVYDDYASKSVRASFAMDGEAYITLNDLKATGIVELRRVASKISLNVKVAETVTDGDEIWRPASNNIVVLITNGVTTSTLSPSNYTPVHPDDYYSTSNGSDDDEYGQRLFEKVEGAEYPYSLTSPFYTMPNKWDEGDLNRERMTYMTLRVPWQKDGESVFQYCYYTVPVTRATETGRNISYTVNLNVDILGSFTPEEPIELPTLSYYAVEWGSVSEDVTISSNRYLVVDRTQYELHNEADIEIPFYTSHETVLKDITVTYYRYSLSQRGTETPITITTAQNAKSTVTIDGVTENIYSYDVQNATLTKPTNQIVFRHKLEEWIPYTARNRKIDLIYNASTNTNPASKISTIDHYVRPDEPEASYTRYSIVITIVHKDMIGTQQEANFTKTIYITQYPHIYIETTENYSDKDGNGTPEQGNLFVNGHNTKDGSASDWYRTSGLSSSNTNACPNKYVITITQLNDDMDYIIGDPRETTPTTLKGWKSGWVNNQYLNFGDNGTIAPEMNWVDAPGIENPTGGNRKLQNYYATDGDVSKARWIAPKYRVASSYGVHSKNSTYATDKARCAGYQEISRPAGRWRMPTVAEVEFIMRLSQEGKIPTLFSEGGYYYMTAQGRIYTDELKEKNKLSTPENKDGGASVRCVYDEWYWGNDTITPYDTKNGLPVYKFTWGDRPRTSTK